MSLRTGAPWSRTRSTTGGFGLEAPADWSEPDPPQRDYKKLFLIVGLAGLSWVATYVGMLELIESNMGSLPIVHKLIIGFSVAMLMTMVVWLLDQMFSPIDWFTRLSYVFGYVFLIDHLHRIRLRLLLEGAGKPLGGSPLGGKRRRPGAIFVAWRLDAPRAVAGDARAALGHVDL